MQRSLYRFWWAHAHSAFCFNRFVNIHMFSDLLTALSTFMYVAALVPLCSHRIERPYLALCQHPCVQRPLYRLVNINVYSGNAYRL